MKRQWIVSVMVAGILAQSGSAAAQVVTEMTPEQVRTAIAFGTMRVSAPDFYEIRKSGFYGSLYKPRLGAFTTPFLRVVIAAYEAKKQYRSFTEADVTAEMVAPELHVYGFSQADGARIANVQAIIITPKGQRHAAAAIHPRSTTEIPVHYRNLMGMKASGTELMAVFPVDVLRDSNEVHIIYDSGVHDGGEYRFCEDCAVEFKLTKGGIR